MHIIHTYTHQNPLHISACTRLHLSILVNQPPPFPSLNSISNPVQGGGGGQGGESAARGGVTGFWGGNRERDTKRKRGKKKGGRERERPLPLVVAEHTIYSTFIGCESREPHGSRVLRIVEESSLWNDIDSG